MFVITQVSSKHNHKPKTVAFLRNELQSMNRTLSEEICMPTDANHSSTFYYQATIMASSVADTRKMHKPSWSLLTSCKRTARRLLIGRG